MSTGLAVSDIVNVQIVMSPIAAALRNFGSLLLLGSTPNVIDSSQRLRSYTSLSGVAADFGTTSPEYLAASLYFAQSPTPAFLYIGFWAAAATSAVLHGGVLSVAQQAIANFTAITTGSLQLTVNGTLKTLAALNFSGAANLNAVAAILQTAIGASATVAWNANYNRFDITSTTTGVASTLTYASPTGSGVDVSGLLGLTAATGALPPVNGIVAETLISAVNTMATVSNDWYGLNVCAPTAVTADHLAIAAFIEAATPSRIYGLTSQDSTILASNVTTDIASQLQALNYKRTFVQYSSSSPYAAISIFGRAFTVDFTGSNTALTVKFKTEPGVAAETMTESQAAAATAKNCNIFVNYQNGTAIVQQGVMSGGFFFDETHGTDWLQNYVQTAVYNLLYTSTTKIPQTDAGINLITNTVDQAMSQGVVNGLLAPGVWTAGGFGALKTGDILPKGYYIYAPPIAQQNLSDRAARKAPTLQVAAKLAGAVHFASVIINVNR